MSGIAGNIWMVDPGYRMRAGACGVRMSARMPHSAVRQIMVPVTTGVRRSSSRRLPKGIT